MRILLLGTGTPRYDLERAGPSQLLDIEGQYILIDCGPLATFRLFGSGIPLGQIDTLFFTHHHHDHNADFPVFILASWYHGRKGLKIFGPEGTRDFIFRVLEIYKPDFTGRQNVFQRHGLLDPEIQELDSGRTYQMEWGEVSTWRTKHNPPNLAYRFTASGRSVVFTGDTAYQEELSDFARGADVLVHEAHMAKPVGSLQLTTEEPTPENIYAASMRPHEKRIWEGLKAIHSSPEEAAMIAQAAGVKKLVLSHISPFRDVKDMRSKASAHFSGAVIIGEDLMTIEVE